MVRDVAGDRQLKRDLGLCMYVLDSRECQADLSSQSVWGAVGGLFDWRQSCEIVKVPPTRGRENLKNDLDGPHGLRLLAQARDSDMGRQRTMATLLGGEGQGPDDALRIG